MTERIRTRHTHQDYNHLVSIFVETDCNGANALDQTTKVGLGCTITRTGIGEYLATLDQPCKRFVTGSYTLLLATPDGSYAVPGDVTAVGDGTYTQAFECYNNAAPSVKFDPAATDTITAHLVVQIVGP